MSTDVTASSPGISQPVVAGVLGAITGFASSFAIVLSGLLAVGATAAEASSGLFALCVAQGLLSIGMAWATRRPIFFSWSTPGAALLAASHGITHSFGAAIGAFLLCGALLTLTGLWPALARAMTRIPVPLTGAMLAGILLELCLAPVRAAVGMPLLAIPIVLVWLVLTRLAPRWAVPAALVVAVAGTVWLANQRGIAPGAWLPSVQLVAPQWAPLVIVSLGIPLYVVTMAGQNIPGFALLSTLGYSDVRPRGVLVSSGLATLAAAPFGGHTLNLSALSAGIVAGPGSHPDPRRRWIAPVTGGMLYIVLGVAAGATGRVFAAASPQLIEAAAGLALIGAFVTSLESAFVSGPSGGHRVAAAVTFLVAASGIVVGGIGSAFWALLVGAAVYLALNRRQPLGTPGEPA